MDPEKRADLKVKAFKEAINVPQTTKIASKIDCI